jgi:hypothetical protein
MGSLQNHLIMQKSTGFLRKKKKELGGTILKNLINDTQRTKMVATFFLYIKWLRNTVSMPVEADLMRSVVSQLV